jgi:hypothetical protein
VKPELKAGTLALGIVLGAGAFVIVACTFAALAPQDRDQWQNTVGFMFFLAAVVGVGGPVIYAAVGSHSQCPYCRRFWARVFTNCTF